MMPEEVFEDCDGSDDELYEDCLDTGEAFTHLDQHVHRLTSHSSGDKMPVNRDHSATSSIVDDPMKLVIREDPVTSIASDVRVISTVCVNSVTSAAGDAPLKPNRGDEPVSSTVGDNLVTSIIRDDTVTSTVRDDALTCTVGDDSLTFTVRDEPLTSVVSDEPLASVVSDNPAPSVVESVTVHRRSSSEESSSESASVARSPSSEWDMLQSMRSRSSADEEEAASLADWHVLEPCPDSDDGSAQRAADHSEACGEAVADEPSEERSGATAATELPDALVTELSAACAEEASPAAANSDQDAELVADPDDVDEEALRQLDDTQTEAEREQRRAEAVRLKAIGNEWYAAGAFDAARERYTAALRVCPLAASRERAMLFSNRAACRARATDAAGAVADCGRALQLEPEYPRPLQRRAELQEGLNKLDEALQDWQQLLQLQPTHVAARAAVARLPAQIAERNEKLKTEMLGKLKELGNMILRPFNMNTDNFRMEQNESGGYSVKFNPT